MFKYFYVGNIRVPAYGLVIIMGCVLSLNIAIAITKSKEKNVESLLYIVACGATGAVFGARLFSEISLFIENGRSSISFLDSGYSYYGGLAGFIFFAFCIGKIKKIDLKQYSANLIFLLPLIHFFWKISCFLGGCCYGIPYDGPLSVCFPFGINPMAGIELVPVQLIEAFVALSIAIIIIFINLKNKLKYPCVTYCFMYSASRFILEFLRYHDNKNGISMGYIYSLICFSICLLYLIIKSRGEHNE